MCLYGTTDKNIKFCRSLKHTPNKNFICSFKNISPRTIIIFRMNEHSKGLFLTLCYRSEWCLVVLTTNTADGERQLFYEESPSTAHSCLRL